MKLKSAPERWLKIPAKSLEEDWKGTSVPPLFKTSGTDVPFQSDELPLFESFGLISRFRIVCHHEMSDLKNRAGVFRRKIGQKPRC